MEWLCKWPGAGETLGKLGKEGEAVHHTLSVLASLLPSGRVVRFLMIIFKKCQASAHLQIIMSNLHTRSRRLQLLIWKLEHIVNKINGLGQLIATVAATDPQAQYAFTTEEVCQSGNLF